MPNSCANSFKILVVYEKEVGSSYQFFCPRGPHIHHFFSIAGMAGSVLRQGKKSIHHLDIFHGLAKSYLSFQNIVEWVPSKFLCEMRHEIKTTLCWISLSYQNYNAVSSGIYRGMEFKTVHELHIPRQRGLFSKWQLNSQMWSKAVVRILVSWKKIRHIKVGFHFNPRCGT